MSAAATVHSRLASADRALSPLRDLPWLARWILRCAPWLTALWALLILADAAFTGLRLWATRGAVNAVVAAVRTGWHLGLVRGTSPGHAPGPLWWFAVLASVEVASRVAALLRPYVRERVRVAAGVAVQEASLDKAGRVPIEAFDVEATHDVIRRVADGGDTRGPDLVAEALALLQQLPSLTVYAVALGFIALWLPFAAAAMECVFIWQMISQGRRARKLEVDWTRQRRLTDYYAQLLTTRAAAAEVRLWRLRPELLRRWRAGLSAYSTARHRLAVRETRQWLPSTFLASGFLVVAVAALAAFRGRIEPGLAALFLTADFGLMGGMNYLQLSMRRFMDHAGYAADLRQLVEGLPAEQPAAGHPERRSALEAAAHVATPTAFPRPMRDGIRFRGVSYRYPGTARDALSSVDLEIRAGEIVALVGPNGAGKTTLAALLLALRRPFAGRIEVDGVDLASIPAEEVRRAFAAVFQQPLRYPGTVRQNVALAAGKDAEVDRAADLRPALSRAGLEELGDRPEQVLSPEFGGVDLSGGQWQRLSIARALFRPEAEVLVFDEPTAALDPLAELALFERFALLAAGRTAVLVSHRLGPTRLAHRVVVLDGGRVVEHGPPADLLATGGAFARMFEAQAAWYR